jgi:hypothetical protein
MRKLLMMLALVLLPLSSQAVNRPFTTDCYCCPDWVRDVSFMIGSGYRQDNLDWRIAGPCGQPEAIEKVNWKGLDIWALDAELDLVICNSILLRVDGTWGKIYHGRVRNSIYAPGCPPVCAPPFNCSCDDNQFEFMRTNAHVRGDVYEASLGLGYQYVWLEADFLTTPLVGYAYDMQRLQMYDATRYINFNPINGHPELLGHISSWHGRYNTRWRGPWIGMNLQWNMDACFTIYAEYQYHWATYRAGGDWEDKKRHHHSHQDDYTKLPSGYSHHAHGKGQIIKAGGEWMLSDGWILGLKGEFQAWNTYKGREKTKAREPVMDAFGNVIEVRLPVSLKLNRVNWRSIAYVAYIGFDW